MGIEMGRVSGHLLSENLLRNGYDLAFETDLLYLDVTNNRIGIRNSAPAFDLFVNNFVKSENLIVDTQLSFSSNYTVSTNKIQNILGSIIFTPNQSTDPKVIAAGLGVGDLTVSAGHNITNIVPDGVINLNPNGTGIVHFTTNTVNVNGDLHATGTITADGNIVIGNETTDSVIFNALVDTTLTPISDNTYNLGLPSKWWKSLYTPAIRGSSVLATNDIILDNTRLATTTGNMIYVSVNGVDTNSGYHKHSPFRTLKHALSVATSGCQIFINSGTYVEEFPLTVPHGVNVMGESIRAVKVKPSESTKSNDAFLLNGDTSVAFLTVQDFFYNSVANTGYAFRFAPGYNTTYKSLYVQNVTVITKGSVTSASDPQGFNQGDAGSGIYLDGSVADPASNFLAGLFYAVTLITPNQNAITATNGVRVEWLNSFTYYAKRGIYLLGDAEFRSINSANIYGTYGIVADGADTLAYICGHNFGYIGCDASSTNDPRLANSSNEVVTLNDGVVYYDSTDHNGNYRIGDVFYVNQETGQVFFDARSVGFDENGNITLQDGENLTVVNFSKVQTGNIRIFDNTVSSIVGQLYFHAVNDIRLNTDVSITGFLNVSDNVTVAGNVYVGDTALDKTSFLSEVISSIIPKTANTYTLGTSALRWDVLRVQLIDVESIRITNDTITTIVNGTDLQLVASNTGRIYIPSNDVQIDNSLTVDNNLTVNGDTSLRNVEIDGTVTLTGDITQTGNVEVTGDLVNQSNIIQSGENLFLDIPDITIQDNLITPINTTSNLLISGNGLSGAILENLKVTNNIIQNIWPNATTDEQRSIILTPTGTGNAVINSNKSLVLPVGTNSTQPLSHTGEIRFNLDTKLFDAYQPSGMVSLYSLFDSDRNTYITPELIPGAADNTLRFAADGTVRATITATALYDNSFNISDVKLLGNIISTINTSNDLLIQPTSGITHINNISIASNYITNTTDDILNLPTIKFTGGANGVIVPQGTNSQRRDVPNVAEFRYNVEQHLYEVYDGTTWIPQGDNPLLLSTVDEEITLWSILLG